MANFRQGEVLIFGLKKTKKKPEDFGFVPKADNVIIEGELSGHKHEIKNGKLYEKDGKIVLEAGKGCTLEHPEHKPIQMQEGQYEIAIQEEFDDEKHTTKVKD